VDDLRGIIKGITNPNDISIDLFENIGNQPQKVKSSIINYTRNLIKSHPTHIITGGYSIGNIENRPQNKFAVVKNRQRMELILNNDPRHNQIIVYGSLSAKSSEWLSKFSKQISTFFMFCSGQEIKETVKPFFAKAESLENTVFLLNPDLLSSKPVPNNVKIIFGEESEELLKSVEDFYGYDNKDSLNFFRSNPHVVLFDGVKIVAGARTNEYSPEIAIIGGVKTLINYRKRGYGTIACHALISFLTSKCQQIALETDLSNFPARKIYENIGFQPVGTSIFFDDQVGVIKNIIGDRDY
jgi:hypothetical protein